MTKRRMSSRLFLEIDEGEPLAAVFADDEAGVAFLDGPGGGKRRAITSCRLPIQNLANLNVCPSAAVSGVMAKKKKYPFSVNTLHQRPSQGRCGAFCGTR
jgi:hypothetical protein